MAGQIRPSAILRRPDPESPISEATNAELLNEVLERSRGMRERESGLSGMARDAAAIAREYSIVISLLEDAITHHNKAVYLRRGVFAITDAERLPSDDEPEPESVPERTLLYGVVARSYDAARERGRLVDGAWRAITSANDARGLRFDDVVYADGWDEGRSTEERSTLLAAVAATLRAGGGSRS